MTDRQTDRPTDRERRSQKFVLRVQIFSAVLYSSNLMSSAAINAQTNFQGLIWVYIISIYPHRYAPADRQTDKPVGFYGPIAPPVPNAPSLRICGQNPRNDADATFLDPHISVVDCLCTLLHAGAASA